MRAVSAASVLREIAGVFLALALITWAITHAPTPLLSEYGHLILAAAFIGAALTLARREHGGAQRFGIDLCGVLDANEDEAPGLAGMAHTFRRALPRLFSELFVALAIAAVVFPIFVVGFRLWHQPTHPFTWQLPRDPIDFVLSQVLVIALPEEALFRGYFQTRLSDRFATQTRVLGVSISLPALVLQALLFAILHFIVAFDPGRLAVFFPALLFGWMRAFRGGIGAAIWFHALCNVLSEVLTRGYL